MMLLSWFRRYPLLGYFALAFGISWGGSILVVLIATGFNLAAPQPSEIGFMFVFMLLGPSISGWR